MVDAGFRVLQMFHPSHHVPSLEAAEDFYTRVAEHAAVGDARDGADHGATGLLDVHRDPRRADGQRRPAQAVGRSRLTGPRTRGRMSDHAPLWT